MRYCGRNPLLEPHSEFLGAGAISPSADVKVPIAVRITVSETSCAGGAGGATGFTGAGAMGGGIVFPSPSLAGIPVASVPDMFTKNRKRFFFGSLLLGSSPGRSALQSAE